MATQQNTSTRNTRSKVNQNALQSQLQNSMLSLKRRQPAPRAGNLLSRSTKLSKSSKSSQKASDKAQKREALLNEQASSKQDVASVEVSLSHSKKNDTKDLDCEAKQGIEKIGKFSRKIRINSSQVVQEGLKNDIKNEETNKKKAPESDQSKAEDSGLLKKRRSSKLTNVNPTRRSQRNVGAQKFYDMDKMTLQDFQKQLIKKEIEKSEQIMIKYAIERSLIEETKYKDNKELNETNPKQWFKYFMKEATIPTQHKKVIIKHQFNSIDLKSEAPLIPETSSQSVQLVESAKMLGSSSKKTCLTQETKNKRKLKTKAKLQSKGFDPEEGSDTISEESEAQSSSDYMLPSKTEEDDDKTEVDQLQELLTSNNTKKQKTDTFQELLPLLKKPVSTEKQDFSLEIANMMDLSIRNEFTSFVKFIDFKNQKNLENATYTPALMQKKQENKDKDDLPQNQHDEIGESTTQASYLVQSNFKGDKSQHHIIKRKQSQCNVKRECGVSYVKKTESKQLNVRDRGYDKLPPLVFQGSYTLPQNKDLQMEKSVQDTIDYLFFTESQAQTLIVTAFESTNEIEMKNYLLKPHKRVQIAQGKFWQLRWQSGSASILYNLWQFVKDKHFLCIHFQYDKEKLLSTFQYSQASKLSENDQILQFIESSDICLGFLPKKGNASVKSMLKVYKLEDHYAPHMQEPQYIEKKINCMGANIVGINTIAYLSRLELYVPEFQWKKSSMTIKAALSCFINQFEEQMAAVLLEWNNARTKVFQYAESNNFFEESRNYIKWIKFDKKAQKSKASEEQKPWPDLKVHFTFQRNSPQKLELEACSNSLTDPIEISSLLRKASPVPVTLINTRDCFAYDLKYSEEVVNLGKGRENVIKKVYYFDPDIDQGFPANFKQTMGYTQKTNMKDIKNLQVGVTCYENFYTHEEMNQMEQLIEDTEAKSLRDEFLPMTAQKTFTGQTLKRTKFFFGYRYMWTKTQLQDPLANVAAGVRADVSQPPVWMKTILEKPLVEAGVVEKDFINSVALNVYHDGSEGLAQHFDDATRFKQPIFTLRLFSDSRLSFGSQYYGFQNSAFTIPLPRGCICKMEEASYSANGVKHCIRPCDMTGKSSAVILRQMHPNVVKEAEKLDRNIDLPMWLSTLSLQENTLPFHQQKEMEYEFLEKGIVCSSSKIRAIQAASEKPGIVSANPIESFLYDLISRIEANQTHDQEIYDKIETLRSKQNPGTIVQLFKTHKETFPPQN